MTVGFRAGLGIGQSLLADALGVGVIHNQTEAKAGAGLHGQRRCLGRRKFDFVDRHIAFSGHRDFRIVDDASLDEGNLPFGCVVAIERILAIDLCGPDGLVIRVVTEAGVVVSIGAELEVEQKLIPEPCVLNRLFNDE